MTLEVIRNNPYQLIEEVDGIGFGRADDIGRALGISVITTTVYAQDVLHVRECLITTWSRLYEERPTCKRNDVTFKQSRRKSD